MIKHVESCGFPLQGKGKVVPLPIMAAGEVAARESTCTDSLHLPPALKRVGHPFIAG